MVHGTMPKVMMWTAIGAGLPALVLAFALQLGAEQFQLVWPMAAFFIGFGLFKGAVGFDILGGLKDGTGRTEALVASLGGAAEVKRYALFRVMVMVIGVVAGLYCLGLAVRGG